MLSCEFKGVADVIVISGEVLGTTVVTAVEASTSPDDGETSGMNTAGSVTAGTMGAGPVTAGSAIVGMGVVDSMAVGMVIGESTADKTFEDNDGTGTGDWDVMGLKTLGCGEDFEEENKDGGGTVPRLSM